jgi:hypothetical protein
LTTIIAIFTGLIGVLCVWLSVTSLHAPQSRVALGMGVVLLIVSAISIWGSSEWR